MKTYTVSKDSLQSISISGDTLVDAVEKNFSSIAQLAAIGNAAGYTLDRVWMDRNNSNVYLHILAHGSDVLIDYDPIADTPKETILVISGVAPDELPAAHEFDIKQTEPDGFDPFDDAHIVSADPAIGAILAIADIVSQKNCSILGDDVTYTVSLKDENARIDDPLRFVDMVLAALDLRKPKQDKDTYRLMYRIQTLRLMLAKLGKPGIEETLFYYKTLGYFNTIGRITALAYYRKKCGLTQPDLAGKIGISTRQLAMYENPRTSQLASAKYHVVSKIAEALGVTPDKLVNGLLPVLVDGK
jgi:DNA-binding XRE family transcriptional regulator